MAKSDKRKPRSAPKGPRPAEDAPPPTRKTALTVRRAPQRGEWQLVHPPCALERAEDVQEAEAMIGAGETELAIEELRWLLQECTDLMPAHQLLGEIALEAGDHALARGHFGYAYHIGRAALPAEGLDGTLPYHLAENRHLHESSKGLAWCLKQLDKPEMALDVVRDMLRWDPSDPLGVKVWLGAWSG